MNSETTSRIVSKLSSRKFWISVAAFLASISFSISGIVTDKEIVVSIGIICGILSAAIYAATEAYVDGKSAESNTTIISATSTSKEVVEAALAAKDGISVQSVSTK